MSILTPDGLTLHPETGIIIGMKGLPISGSKDSCGYRQIDFRGHGGKIVSAHRYMWEAVNGPIPKGMEINHVNRNKQDNRISNLELITHQQNICHACASGLKSNKGEMHPSATLTHAKAKEIRLLYAQGKRVRDIAKSLGVHRKTVSDVVWRKTWNYEEAL